MPRPLPNVSHYFYPRSPCGERRLIVNPKEAKIVFLSTLSLRRATGGKIQHPRQVLFLSTLSLRRATNLLILEASANIFLSTLSLRRATSSLDSILAGVNISIHALLAESDMRHRLIKFGKIRFLSTLSLRRATVSICYMILPPLYFYPRSPCGERPCA